MLPDCACLSVPKSSFLYKQYFECLALVLQYMYLVHLFTVCDKDESKAASLGQGWSKNSKGKRVRTIFTPEQLERMEAEFERQQYMVGTERYVDNLQILKVWFIEVRNC